MVLAACVFILASHAGAAQTENFHFDDVITGAEETLTSERAAGLSSAKNQSIKFPASISSHGRVNHFLKVFSGSGRRSFRQALERSGRYKQTITAILRAHGLPEDLLYLCLVESGFFPFAVSTTNTTGLWQFTHGTARTYGLTIDPWQDERKDPVKSTYAAAAYLTDLRRQFGAWLWAVAAYNAGDEGIRRVLRQTTAGPSSPLDPKVPIKPLTRDFVAKFVASVLIAREPHQHGFADIVYDAHLNYDEILVPEPLALTAIAARSSTTVEAILKLNPALLRKTTPPQEKPFRLRLPVGRGGIFSGFSFALPELPRMPSFLRGKTQPADIDPTSEFPSGDF